MESSTVTGLLKGVAEKFPTRIAISVSGSFDITHERLDQLVERAAACLLDAGVRRGDVVALAFPNTVEFVIMLLAVIRVRAVGAPLNKAFSSEEFEFYLSDSKSKLLLTPIDGNVAAQTAASKLNIRHATVTLISVDSDVTFTLSHPESGSNSNNNSMASVINEPFDVALFLHTSGTTSQPKGVPLSQQSLVSSVRNFKSMYRLTESDSTVIVLPLFHIHGLIAALLSSLGAGASVTLPAAGRFLKSTFWADMKRSNATWYTAVPRIHQIILDSHISNPEPEYPCLRFIRSCSASLDPDVLNSLQEAFGAPVVEAYAMTDSTHHLMCTDPLPEDVPHKPGLVVCIRDLTLSKRYKNILETNNSTSPFGWFCTRADGFYNKDVDIKELFNRGGLKIYPIESDAVSSSHPESDGAQALHFTVPDNIHGEEFRSSHNDMGSSGRSRSSSSTPASTSNTPASTLDRPEASRSAVSKMLIAVGRNVNALAFVGFCKTVGIGFPELSKANGNHELDPLVDNIKRGFYGAVYLLTICSMVMKPSTTYAVSSGASAEAERISREMNDRSLLLSGAAVLLLVFGILWGLCSPLLAEPAYCLCCTSVLFIFVLFAAAWSSLLEDHI